MSRTDNGSPLSHGQEALWFLARLVPRTWAYNIVLPVAVRGAFDPAAFARALARLTARHPSLRTAFHEDGGRPYQESLQNSTPRIEHIDAAGWSEDRIAEAIRERAQRPFDLEADATLRTTLLRRSDDHYVLTLVVHHIVSDLWSLIVVMDELRQLYAAECNGMECHLPSLPVAYGNYVREQRAAMEGEAGERLWEYWRDELSGELAVLDLPTDHPRPAMQSFRGGTVTRRMDAELTRDLKTLAGKERVTLFMALLAAYEVLLSRTTGQESFAVGSPTSGRDRAELQGLVGDFVNMVPLRADLTGSPTFRQLLGRVRANVVATIQHADYPFSLLVDRLHLPRDLSRSPLFQTTFVLQKFHRYGELSRVMLPGDDEPSIPFGELTLEPIALAQQDGQFDLNLEMKEDDRGQLVGAWKYSAELFEPESIARMARHFETLLRDLAANPDRPIAELRLLTEEESREAIAVGRGPAVPLPNAVTVCELFERQAAQRGDALAVTCGAQSLTYAQLLGRVTTLADALTARGVTRNDLVAVLLPRGLDFITALLAIQKAGAAFLPLDVRHPQSRTQQIVSNSGAVLIVEGRTSNFEGRSSNFEGRTSNFELRGTNGEDRSSVSDDRSSKIENRTDDRSSKIEARSSVSEVRSSKIEDRTEDRSSVSEGRSSKIENRTEARSSKIENRAYVMYTSGSTGAPKGVMVEHRGMVNHVLAKLDDLGMGADDVLAQNGPPTFDIVVWQCLAPLVVGGRVVVFPDDVAEDPARLLEEVERSGVTVLQVVPSMLRAILDESAAALPALRWIVPTGEALPTELCRRWLARHPHIPLLNTYGSTECSDDQCHYAIRALSAADEAVAVASIGTPIRNMTAYVLDAQLAPVPVGVVGDLYIGGIGVGRGYLNDPERTAAAFIADPFSSEPGARLYRTRDLARRRADGTLDFLGRTDDVIKLHGFRIEPGEIVAALCRHPHVSAAAVVMRERQLVAYVVGQVVNHVPADELKRFLGERLPHYMIPSTFTSLDALPLTANGKLDGKRLPAPEWDTSAEQELIPPRTKTETTLAAIWAEVLGVGRIGVTQDFFAIGGDSIRSIQIVARCKRAGLNVRPSDLFQHSTIAALAAFAETNKAEDDVTVAALDVSDAHLELALAQVSFDEEA